MIPVGTVCPNGQPSASRFQARAGFPDDLCSSWVGEGVGFGRHRLNGSDRLEPCGFIVEADNALLAKLFIDCLGDFTNLRGEFPCV